MHWCLRMPIRVMLGMIFALPKTSRLNPSNAVLSLLAVQIPEGYAGFVLPRSGLALKQGLSLVNAPGLIDSNYRGELKAIAINLDPQDNIEIHIGDRIAQLVIMKVEAIHFNEVDDLEHSDRGEGGFGSSGVSYGI